MKRFLCSLLAYVLSTASPLVAADLELPHYEMTISLVSDMTSIAVAGEVVVPATSETRKEIVLGLSEVMDELSAEVVAPAMLSGTRAVRGELLEGPGKGWGTYRYLIRPDQPIPAGTPVRIAFRYRGSEATAFVYHLGTPVTFAAGINTSWYPQVADPRVESKEWSGLRGTGTLNFVMAEAFAVCTAGRADKKLAEARTFSFDMPVYFAFSAAAYRVLEGGDDSKICAYFLRQRDGEQAFIERNAAVLKVLEGIFGTYPHNRFAVVEVPTKDASAAGFAGASLEGFIMANESFLDRTYNVAYYGHEISHQWWGNLVSMAALRGDMGLTEGMAQYGSLVAVNVLDGPAMAERYRRVGYPGYISNQSGLGYLCLAAAGYDAPIPDANQGAAARIIADGKGFQVWNMLADEVGMDRFHRALLQLVERHRHQPVTWEEFLSDLETTVGEDLQWFYDQWFERTGAPELSLEWRRDGGSLVVVVTQPEPLYRLTIDVDITDSSGCVHTQRAQVDGPETTLRLPMPGARLVELDPRFRILRWTREYRDIAGALVPATRGYMNLWAGRAEAAKDTLVQALAGIEHETDADLHGRRFAVEALMGQILVRDGKFVEARKHLEAALRSPSRRPETLPWVYFNLGRVAIATGDNQLLQEVEKSIASADALAGRVGAVEELRAALAAAAHKGPGGHGGD